MNTMMTGEIRVLTNSELELIGGGNKFWDAVGNFLVQVAEKVIEASAVAWVERQIS